MTHTQQTALALYIIIIMLAPGGLLPSPGGYEVVSKGTNPNPPSVMSLPLLHLEPLRNGGV